MTISTRAFAFAPQVQADSRRIGGLAAAFYDPDDPKTVYRYQMLRPGDKSPIDIEERILQGAFDLAVKEDELICAYNHTEILGRRDPLAATNNLSLGVVLRGLEYSCEPPVDYLCDRVVGLVRSGIVKGSSFKFSVREGGVTYRQEQGSKYLIRELTALRLHDVAPVDEPAYAAATVSLRAEERSAAESQQINALLEIPSPEPISPPAPAPTLDRREHDRFETIAGMFSAETPTSRS